MIITIDGPAGTGKTTVAKKVAEKLHLPYFDTGAMYRAATWALLEAKIPLDDSEKIQSFLKDQFSFKIILKDGQKRYFVEDTDVTEEIRSQKVNASVSQVSALPPIRKTLWEIQRSFAKKTAAVFEGRDMGSAVFPDADLKIFLTAHPEVRAERRLNEIKATRPQEAEQWDRKKMIEEIKRRDDFDSSRELAPLKCPKNAITIDTSNLTIHEVVNRILEEHDVVIKKMEKSWLYGQMKLFYRFIIMLTWIMFKIFYRHKVYGLEHFYRGPGIIAANHISYLDPPLIAISWPEEMHFLAKESLFKPFIFGRFIRALNSHPISGDVSDISVFKAMIKLLESGKKVILFPEGARSQTGELGEIKPGISLLVSRTEAPIIPVYIHGTFEIWNPKRKKPKLHGKTACVFGKPLYWESFSDLGKKQTNEALAQALRKAILDLKHWYEKGAKGVPP